MGAKIESIEYYLPNQTISTKDLKKFFPEIDVEKIENKVGIKKRHIVKKNQTALDLAFEASKICLNNIKKNKIDFILLCTQSPDYFLPTTACLLQEMLELPDNIGALDFNLGCSGYIYGLAIAKGLINSNISENLLFVTTETYSKHIYKKDKSNRIIFGDGAAATILTKSKKEHIWEFELGTDGKGKNKLIVPNGGLRNPFDSNAKEIKDDSGNTRTQNHLFMDGPSIFNFTIEKVPKLVEETLNKNSVKIENIDYVIFHQANKYMLDYLKRKIKIPEEKFYMDMENTGNTVSSTIPIALKDALSKKLITPGNKVLLVGFGVGYSWGATIIDV